MRVPEQERYPQSKEARSRAAIRRFDLSPASKPYAPKPSEEWNSCLHGSSMLEGTPGASYLLQHGIPEEVATAAGVRFSASWTGFQHPCLVFPALDVQGRQIAVQAWSITTQEKRSEGSIGLGLFVTPGAFSEPVIVLTSSPLDALSFAACGVSGLALFGSVLCEWLLPALSWRTVLLAFDADDAGDKAAASWTDATALYGVKVYRLRPVGGRTWNEVLTSCGPASLSPSALGLAFETSNYPRKQAEASTEATGKQAEGLRRSREDSTKQENEKQEEQDASSFRADDVQQQTSSGGKPRLRLWKAAGEEQTGICPSSSLDRLPASAGGQDGLFPMTSSSKPPSSESEASCLPNALLPFASLIQAARAGLLTREPVRLDAGLTVPDVAAKVLMHVDDVKQAEAGNALMQSVLPVILHDFKALLRWYNAQDKPEEGTR